LVINLSLKQEYLEEKLDLHFNMNIIMLSSESVLV
jgi:hypothetical protein